VELQGSMSETRAAADGTERLATDEIRKAAVGAALFAIVLAAVDTFAGSSNGGIVELVIVAAVVAVAAAGVFLWGVPWALTLEEPGAAVVAVLSSLLGLLTVVIFWSGLPPVFAVAGILIGRGERSAYEGRFYAQAAIVMGVAALVLDVVQVFLDIV
jgi:hypothetical protein